MSIINKMPKNAAYSLTQSSNFLPFTALFYDVWRERSLSLLTQENFGLEREFALLRQWMDVQPNQTFLDVGTSTGNYARVLARAGGIVTAIDISKPMLEKAVARGNNEGITYEQVNAEYLPYPDSSFDGIVIGASLNEFHNTKRALEQAARVLKDQGKLFIMYLRESDTGFGKIVQAPFKFSGVRFPNRLWLAQTLSGLGVQAVRSEVRRAVAIEMFVKSEVPLDSSINHRTLTRAAGKPAKEPIV
jgi:SAM-dependent methyltransferase